MTSTFTEQESDITARAHHVLRTVFGFDAFRGPQEEIITWVAGGGDAFVLMPTGSGKSLCYQLPALLRPGVGVVVSPLIALMQDQVSALAAAWRARRVSQFHAVRRWKRREVEQQVVAGGLDLALHRPGTSAAWSAH